MPSSKKTAHGLNLWGADDRPMRGDFVSDNQLTDDLISKHMADTTLHKTKDDPTPLDMGNYTGSGGDTQVIALSFTPQAVFLYPENDSPLQKDTAGSLVLYAAMVSGEDYGAGVYIDGSTFVVMNSTAAGVHSKLNEKGRTYRYLAFR
ncbi:MAG: hypothetical protein LKE53_09230 [Oscillospiraceae bacterium]|jgi:hypothetical protein|nr:hypothetical protein [Oscillospiraceae bacterium]MDD3260432.1 hypothetical protein [Oscillospiraceae bacterium]